MKTPKYKCNLCGKRKPTTEFYALHKTQCKKCYKAKQQAYYDSMSDAEYKAHLDKNVKSHTERYHNDPEYRAKHLERTYATYLKKRNTEEYRKKRREYARRRYQNDPEHRAKTLANLKTYRERLKAKKPLAK
jgi:hypothetical protein